MRIRLAAADVTLDLQIADRLPDVAANEAQLELALLNLVVNALDAMPHGGTLTLAADRGPNGVRIEVQDTGSGIAADVLPENLRALGDDQGLRSRHRAGPEHHA